MTRRAEHATSAISRPLIDHYLIITEPLERDAGPSQTE